MLRRIHTPMQHADYGNIVISDTEINHMTANATALANLHAIRLLQTQPRQPNPTIYPKLRVNPLHMRLDSKSTGAQYLRYFGVGFAELHPLEYFAFGGCQGFDDLVSFLLCGNA